MVSALPLGCGAGDSDLTWQALGGVGYKFNKFDVVAAGGQVRMHNKGKIVPFSNHQSTYQVDLDAIPFGSELATMVVLDLLAK